MKVCEKWQESLSQKGPEYRNPFTQKVYEIGQREGWGAALKMVLNQMSINRFMTNEELQTFIEQELDEN